MLSAAVRLTRGHMDSSFWTVFVATVAGNLLTVWFLFSVYKLAKAESIRADEKRIWYAGAIMPTMIVAAGVYLLS